MTITMTAPHGLLIESLSRLAVLVYEHREELPDLYVCLSSERRQIIVQLVEHGAAEPERRAGVDRLSQILKLDQPEVVCGFYQTGNDLWDVYTQIKQPGDEQRGGVQPGGE